MQSLEFLSELYDALGIEEAPHEARSEGGVGHVGDRPRVCGSDAHGSVHRVGRRPTYEEGDLHPSLFHQGCDARHFLEGGGYQPRKPHHVGFALDCRVEYFFGGHHDAQVDDLVVIAGQDHGDNVLADVVDVALYGRDHHPPSARAPHGLLGLDVGQEDGYRLLHNPCALDHLGEEHLPLAEEPADDVHPFHQRAFDDVDGMLIGRPYLFNVPSDIKIESLDQRVLYPF